MTQLRTQDLSEVLELGRIALHCDSLLDLQQTSLKLLEKTLGAESSLYFSIFRDHSHWSFDSGLSRGVPKQGPELWNQRYHKQDPFVQAFLEMPRQGSPVVVSTQILSHKKLIATEFYVDFLQPQSIYHVMILGLISHHQPIGLFGFHRPPGALPFSARDAEKACLLSPYLSAAVEKMTSKEDTSCYRDAIERMAYNLSDRGIIILDRANRPLYTNSKADDLLRLASEPRSAPDRPDDYIPSHVLDFCRRLEDRKLEEQTRGLPNQSGEHRFQIQTPFAKLTIEFHTGKDGTQVVYLNEGDSSNIRQDRLAQFGLTKRQRAIVHLLSTGMTNPEIADKLCISIRTVQNHLRSIYTKVDVHNRTSLVNRLSH